MTIPVILFALGLVLLIRGGDWFVDGASSIARRFHLPEMLIGATVVSIGTTLPEVMVSVQAALQHNAGISYGNAIGSIICNTSLIAALTIAVRPGAIQRKTMALPTAAFFVAALFYATVARLLGGFLRLHGVILLLGFALYMALTVRAMRAQLAPAAEAEEASPLWRDVALLLLGTVMIALGANLLVNNGTILAKAMGVPDSVIGLTMVALGTSLPELVTAITALAKGHSALSLGNIIGANLFNLVLVSGASIAISPFTLPAERMLLGQSASLVVDIPLMFAVMAILCLPALWRGRLARWQGVLLLGIYAAFTVYQFAA